MHMWQKQGAFSLSLAHELVLDYCVIMETSSMIRSRLTYCTLTSMSTYDEERALYLHRNGRPRRPRLPHLHLYVSCVV